MKLFDWIARQNTNAHSCYLVFLYEQTHKKQLQRFYLAAFCAWHSETVPCIRANFYTPCLHTYFTYPFIAPFLIFIILNTPTRHINTSFIYNTSKPKKNLNNICIIFLGIICVSTTFKNFSLQQASLVFLSLKDLKEKRKKKPTPKLQNAMNYLIKMESYRQVERGQKTHLQFSPVCQGFSCMGPGADRLGQHLESGI